MRKVKSGNTIRSNRRANGASAFRTTESDHTIFSADLLTSGNDLINDNIILIGDALIASNQVPAPANDIATSSIPEGQTTSSSLNTQEASPTSTDLLVTEEAASTSEAVKTDLPTTPRSPQEDPNFQSLLNRVDTAAGVQARHEPSRTLSQSAQAAAPSPSNERTSLAQVQQVEVMEAQEPGEFSADAFKELLLDRIRQVLPKNEKEADDFVKRGKLDEVKNTANQKLATEKGTAVGAIENTSRQNPNVDAVPERPVQVVNHPKRVGLPDKLEPAKGMPPSRPQAEITTPLNEQTRSLDDRMNEAQVSDEQLARSNEPQFISALDSKNQAKQHAQTSPSSFRQEETSLLQSKQRQAEQDSSLQFQNINSQRAGLLAQVVGLQSSTSQNDTAERQRIADRINGFYESTKADVENILESLDGEVDRRFDSSNERAQRAFEDYVDQKMDQYKEQRYEGVGGAFVWVGDVFTGLPDEVNAFFIEGRQRYIDIMDIELTGIAAYIADELNSAKARISKGKEEVQEYVDSLPENLRQIGQDAADNIQSKFGELEANVDSKQEELVDHLAQRYSESLEEVDARIEEMKAANRGLVGLAMDAVAGVIETIINLKNMLMNLLQGLVEAVQAIIADPIGFLGNLLRGVGQGIINFGANILKHLTSGLITWLTGTLGPVGIKIPDNLFSLAGIFNLVAQILGITWDFIRRKAVKLLGEPVVKAIETGFEIFLILRKDGVKGLWEYIKDKFNDLKETVLGAIQNMVITQVVQAGIKWILGLLSPASAFVKAVMLIIDVVKFFIQRGSQIIQLVKAFIEGVKAIASGAVDRVAKAIENALARAVPVLIGFLAALLGIGGLANKVTNFIKKIRARIEQAVDKLIQGIKRTAMRFFRRVTGKKKGDRKGDEKLKDTEVGKSLNFSAKGEGHRMWVDTAGQGIEIKIASQEMTVGKKLDEWQNRISEVGDKREQANRLITQARGQYQSALQVGGQAEIKLKDAVKSDDARVIKQAEEADDTLEAKEDSLKNTLIALFQLFGDSFLIEFKPINGSISMHAGTENSWIKEDRRSIPNLFIAGHEVRDLLSSIIFGPLGNAHHQHGVNLLEGIADRIDPDLNRINAVALADGSKIDVKDNEKLVEWLSSIVSSLSSVGSAIQVSNFKRINRIEPTRVFPVQFDHGLGNNQAILLEYRRQLSMQQEGMNQLTVDRWVANRNAYRLDDNSFNEIDRDQRQLVLTELKTRAETSRANARKHKAKYSRAILAIEDALKHIDDPTFVPTFSAISVVTGRFGNESSWRRNQRSGINALLADVRDIDSDWATLFSRSAVLHNADQIAGGFGEIPKLEAVPEPADGEDRTAWENYTANLEKYVGSASVNSSIGSLWKDRIEGLHNEIVTNYPTPSWGIWRMNVQLT